MHTFPPLNASVPSRRLLVLAIEEAAGELAITSIILEDGASLGFISAWNMRKSSSET
jgi:hypothetical protein